MAKSFKKFRDEWNDDWEDSDYDKKRDLEDRRQERRKKDRSRVSVFEVEDEPRQNNNRGSNKYR
jgi:hypothetical protein